MSTRRHRTGRKKYAALGSSDEEVEGYGGGGYHEDKEDDTSDDEALDHARRPKRRRFGQSSVSNRDKAILAVGITLICCLLIIGSYSLYEYATDEPESVSQEPTTTTTAKTTGVEPTDATTPVTSEFEDSTDMMTQTAIEQPTTTSETAQPTPGTGNGTGSNGGLLTTFPGLSKNGIGLGLLPDYQDQTLCEINEALGVKFSFHGWYGQLPESGEWDGAQILGSVFDDVVKSGAIFQPAVMPNKNNWAGLSAKDNYQAKAIAKVMKKYTDAGVEVWLRFAHEVNWYQTDGTYSGKPEDFKTAWAAVYDAVKDNPKVRMFYCPNVAASLDDYVRYMPDPNTVHVIGIDYYPRDRSERFLPHVKPLYDKYCKSGEIKFCIGETGVWWNGGGSIEEKFAWMDEMTSDEVVKAMPNFVGIMWFNYDKEQAFKLWKKGSDSDNEFARKWFRTGTSQSGAKMGN
ncbi:hypothetical protein ACM66B_006338 [Microbotryomycetes sp. NB124-2]